MNCFWFICLTYLVFFSSASIDFANTRYVMAVGRRDGHVAGLWAVAHGAASLVGFIVAVKYTLWLLPFELAGYYCGSNCSIHWSRDREKDGSGARV